MQSSPELTNKSNQIKVSAIVPAGGEARTSEEQHVPCTKLGRAHAETPGHPWQHHSRQRWGSSSFLPRLRRLPLFRRISFLIYRGWRPTRTRSCDDIQEIRVTR